MKVIHLTGQAPYYTNSFLLITDKKRAIAIDPAATVDQYNELLARENATLTHIFLTHGHFDHVYSVSELQAKWNCAVYLDGADAKGSETFPLTGETRHYTDGGQVVVDDGVFQTWHTPGHTPGSWILYCSGLLFVGDTLFQNSVGRTDLEGGDSFAQGASLRKIKALPLAGDTQVLPGHGSFTTLETEKENNPFLAF